MTTNVPVFFLGLSLIFLFLIAVKATIILSDFPVGTIVQWVSYNDTNKELDNIPRRFIEQGWLVCNGQEIKEGKLKGKRTPDLRAFANNIRSNLPETQTHDTIENFVSVCDVC